MGKRRNRLHPNIDAARWLVVCGGKTMYYKLKEAQNAARLARDRSGHKNIQHFLCQGPGRRHYHTGHDKNRDRNGNRLNGKKETI